MPNGRSIPEIVVQAMDRVEGALDRRWTLEAFAAEACFSPFHFHRMFREAMGETPAAFVERIRLERAALLLLAADTPITELAWDIGFRHPETLARRFRARFGISASSYRGHQLATWRRMGLDAGADPLPGPGRIEVRHLDPGPLEAQRQIGVEEGFVFDPGETPWCDGGRAPRELYGVSLDWPGITEAGFIRQDWARPVADRTVTPGWVRRADVAGLYATLTAPGPGPISNTVYQRLFVWSLEGRFRLRPGPILEIARGRDILTCQPVYDTEEAARACSSTR